MKIKPISYEDWRRREKEKEEKAAKDPKHLKKGLAYRKQMRGWHD